LARLGLRNRRNAQAVVWDAAQLGPLAQRADRRFVVLGKDATNAEPDNNHPSGDSSANQADVIVTRALQEAAKIIHIELLDHVIVGDVKSEPLGGEYFSLREAGYP
jgi:RadC-like JAB domain